MHLLHINARSYGRIFEVLPEEVENAELIAEEAVSHLLLGLFDEVIVHGTYRGKKYMFSPEGIFWAGDDR